MAYGIGHNTSYVCASRSIELGILSFVQKNQLDKRRRFEASRLIKFITREYYSMNKQKKVLL